MIVRFARLPVAVVLADATLVLPIEGAAADPRPTEAQARAKLSRLNDRADKVVDRFNAARERYRAARKRYDNLADGLRLHQDTVEDLRRRFVGVVRSTYQGGDLGAWPGMVTSSDPTTLLGGLTSISQLSARRARSLDALHRATRALRDRTAQARTAYKETDRVLAGVRAEKAEVERLVAQQTRLLRRLGGYNSGDRRSKGIKYTGNASGDARAVLGFAYAQVGKPYQYGGEGPGGWDCSGLTQASWRAAGVSLPRTTHQQWAWGADRRVSLDSLRPGDLVFSYGLGHVGIYAGDGKMVHAPQTGDVVKVVALSSYGSRLMGAVRP